ncbi:MAG: hypothetical protein LBT23_12480 [Synergistaceae bacterium]|nr:hypothetical protein [Synergistaceae bacterium]
MAGFTLAIFIGQTSFPLAGGSSAEALMWDDVHFSAPLKEDNVVFDDDQLTEVEEIRLKANVLFMMDASAPMLFTPNSALPTVVLQRGWRDSGREGADWTKTWTIYRRTVEDIIHMMKYSTFGIGMMPPAWSGSDLHQGRNLYGRDIDESNNFTNKVRDAQGNIIGSVSWSDHEELMKINRMNYYFPFSASGNASDDLRITEIKNGYAAQSKPLEISYSGYGDAKQRDPSAETTFTATEIGTNTQTAYTYKSNAKISGASSFRYALVFKDPSYWESGWPGPGDPAAADLVPNDSRMYQAKLAMWHLLEKSSNWDGIRFGLSTTFLSIVNDEIPSIGTAHFGHDGTKDRYDFPGLYKVFPYGSNSWTTFKFKDSGQTKPDGTTVYFPDGLGSDSDTGTALAKRRQFVNGILNQPISGNRRQYNGMHAQFFPMWAHASNETIYSNINTTNYSSASTPRMQAMYKTQHRASLLVPFHEYNHVWSAPEKTLNNITQAQMIRRWIDGFADLDSGKTSSLGSPAETGNANRKKQWNYYKNPEIGVAGVFLLPHAIFPDPRSGYAMDRTSYQNNTYYESTASSTAATASSVWYSNKSKNVDYTLDFHPASTQFEFPELESTARFNSGSGEAVGSVLDFFSPKITTGSKNNLIDAQFPIQSPCENNWVIVISTGEELKPEENSAYTYPTYQAIKNLYDATNKENSGKIPASFNLSDGGLNGWKGDKIYAKYERVTMLVRNMDGTVKASTPAAENPRTIDLDNPIRTIVVGVIPNWTTITDPIEKQEIKEMQLNLTRMATAGRGGNPESVTLDNMADAPFQPVLAHNTELLTQAIINALQIIKDSSVIQPGKGVVAQARAVEGLGDSSDLFTYKYRVMRSNQWEAEVTRYAATSSDLSGEWNLIMEKKWEMGENINGPSRNLAFWYPGTGNNWKYSGLAALSETNNTSLFSEWTGINDYAITPPSGGNFDTVKPHIAMVKWLKGYDYAYSAIPEGQFPRSKMLTDFGAGGMVVVQNPVKGVYYLPGYKEWADIEWSKSPPQDNILYGQTNDGVLHMVNISNGNETKAILPPPSLLPGRLASLTTFETMDDKRQWNLILGNEASGGQRSNAVYTLDGALQERDWDLKQAGIAAGWGSYLIGALGKGGAGLYMVDVSDHNAPSFKWYKERVGNILVRALETTPTGSGTSHGAEVIEGSSLAGNPDAAFMKLGFNSPKPGLGVALLPDGTFQNFIVMAGGAQFNPDLNNNGADGATLILLDPNDGNVIVDNGKSAAYTAQNVASDWSIGSPFVGPNPTMGMMTTEPTLMSSAGAHPLASYITGQILTGDNQGNIFSLDMESPASGVSYEPKDWTLRTLAALRSNAEIAQNTPKNYAAPMGLAVGMKGGYRWIAGGTSDIKVLKNADDNYESGWIRNEKQFIFAFKTGDAQTAPYTRDKLKALGISPDEVFNPNDPGPDGDSLFKGWHMVLDDATVDAYREYVSARPVIVNGTLFVATFTRTDKTDAADSSVCTALGRAINGYSKLYAMDVSTGAGNTWLNNDKMIEFKGAKIVGLNSLVESGLGKLLISFDILDDANNIDDVIDNQPILNRVRDENNDIIPDFGTVDMPLGGGTFKMAPNISVLNFWLKR